jgi:hypothetical protein
MNFLVNLIGPQDFCNNISLSKTEVAIFQSKSELYGQVGSQAVDERITTEEIHTSGRRSKPKTYVVDLTKT